MRLFAARHATPCIAPGTCYGALDIAADATHTRSSAERLAQALPRGLSVRCSPQRRCVQLAKALAALRPDLQATPDARLREMHFGDWEGLAWSVISRAAMQAWTDDFWNHRPGGHGEPVRELFARVASAWQACNAETLWITHAGVIRTVTLLAAGYRELRDARQWPAQAPAFGEWAVLDTAPGLTCAPADPA